MALLTRKDERSNLSWTLLPCSVGLAGVPELAWSHLFPLQKPVALLWRGLRPSTPAMTRLRSGRLSWRPIPAASPRIAGTTALSSRPSLTATAYSAWATLQQYSWMAQWLALPPPARFRSHFVVRLNSGVRALRFSSALRG